MDDQPDVHDQRTYNNIKAPGGLALVRDTRLGRLCSPTSAPVPKGSLTTILKQDGQSWSGGDVSAFVMTTGAVTAPHLDVESVFDKQMFVHAAATLRCINRFNTGFSKRAVIVSRRCKEKTIDVLDLKVDRPPNKMYSANGEIVTLDDFVGVLVKHDIDYVDVRFPSSCSYVIPSGCVHMFETLDLVESALWSPSI